MNTPFYRLMSMAFALVSACGAATHLLIAFATHMEMNKACQCHVDKDPTLCSSCCSRTLLHTWNICSQFLSCLLQFHWFNFRYLGSQIAATPLT